MVSDIPKVSGHCPCSVTFPYIEWHDFNGVVRYPINIYHMSIGYILDVQLWEYILLSVICDLDYDRYLLQAIQMSTFTIIYS